MSMRKKYSGSVVRANPVVPTEDSASGIWTLDQQNQNQKRGTWPFVGDPNFKDTVLLLHGDTSQTPSSESQSADNQEVRLIGDAKATNWNPFNLPEGYWSVAFDGSSHIDGTLSSAIGTGDMTVEFWFNPTSFYNYIAMFAISAGSNRGAGFNIGTESTNSGQLKFVDTGLGSNLTVNSQLELGVWKHIACTRSGTTVRLFVNGTEVGSYTDGQNWTGTSFAVGGRSDDGTEECTGYIANLNLVIGTAKYTTSFSKPTFPITAHVNTKLLTCQSNSFVDKSVDSRSISLDGTPRVETFSPFSYTPIAVENNYGSYYFDGSTTQVAYPSNVNEFTFGTGDFHYEFWLYPTGGSGAQRTLIGRDSTGDANINYIYLTTGNHFNWYLTGSINLGSSTLIHLYSWYHLVVSRKDGTLRLFVNGEQKASAANTTSMIDPVHTTIGSGDTDGTQHPFTGYIYNVIVKSKGVDSVTVPTKPTELTLTEGENSVYFDGSGDYLKLTNTNFTDFDFGTGPFLIEGWIYYTTLGTTILGQTGWGNVFQRNITSNVFQFYQAASAGDSGAYWITGTTTLQTYKWYHFALQRDNSGNLDLWVNGSRDATNTTYASTEMKFHSGKGDITVAYWNGGVSAGVNYISNLRIKNSAVYTSGATITVPTAPSPATTGVLLACASRYIEDRSPANHDIAAYGNAVVSGFNPFNEGYWSVHLDSTSDKIQVATASALPSGTAARTIEFWAKVSGAPDSTQYFFGYGNNSAGGNFSWARNGSGKFAFFGYNGYDWDTTVDVPLTKWFHVSLTYNGSQIKFYLDGSLSHTQSYSGSTASVSNLYINQEASGSGFAFANLKISNFIMYSSVVRTGDFTAPTVPETDTTNVVLLVAQSSRPIDNSSNSNTVTLTGATLDEDIPFTLPSRQTKLLAVHNNQDVNNNSFQDSSLLKNFITRTGNVAQGTFSPFSAEEGYWSYYSDGDDAFTVAASSEHTLDADFTVEFFVYPIETFGHHIYLSAINGSADLQIGYKSGDRYLHVWLSGGGNKILGASSANSLIRNQWNHVVFCRSSGTIALLSNGNRLDTASDTQTMNFSGLNIGRYSSGGYDQIQYMSNVRIVKGSCEYDISQTTYTQPSSPLTAITNTKLLTLQSNRFVDNSTSGHVLSVVNTPKITSFAPFAPRRSYSKEVVGGSAYFDGTDDKLTVAYGESIGAGDFTISAWVYRTSSGTYPVILDTRSSDADTKPVIYTDGSSLYYYTAGGIRITGSSAINNNEWIFVRLVKESNVTKLFVNGTQVGSDYSDSNNYTPTNDWEIGSRHTDQHYWPGYISNLQVVLTALDGTSVPTAPFTSDANTRLLLNSTDGAVIDNTGKNNLETVNDAKVFPYTKKFGNGSMYFDGTGDKMILPHSELQQLNTGQFTVELFVYFTATDARQGFFGNDGGWYFQIYDGELEFALGVSAIIERTFSHSLNQWYHLAATRDSSNDVRLFIDGTQQGAVVNSTANLRHNSNVFHIGNIGPNTTRPFKGGYMDEIRITKGVARYISDFTAPTRAFKNR